MQKTAMVKLQVETTAPIILLLQPTGRVGGELENAGGWRGTNRLMICSQTRSN